MRRVFVLAIVAPLIASPLHAQGMSEDVAALHRTIFEATPGADFRDPASSGELALRYLEGRGVARDPLIACGLLFLTDHAVSSVAPQSEAAGETVRRLREEHCGPGAGPVEDLETIVNASCGMFGPSRHIVPLEPGSWLEIGPGGLILDRPAGRLRHPLPFTCATQYVLARYVATDESSAAPTGRRFVEFLTWQTLHAARGPERTLAWTLVELVGSEFQAAAHELLIHEPGSQWPTPQVPAAFAGGASFRTAPGGAVQWRFETDPPRAGVIEPVR